MIAARLAGYQRETTAAELQVQANGQGQANGQNVNSSSTQVQQIPAHFEKHAAAAAQTQQQQQAPGGPGSQEYVVGNVPNPLYQQKREAVSNNNNNTNHNHDHDGDSHSSHDGCCEDSSHEHSSTHSSSFGNETNSTNCQNIRNFDANATQTTKSSSSSGPPSSRSRSSSSSTITDLEYSSKSDNGCGNECGSSPSPTNSPVATTAASSPDHPQQQAMAVSSSKLATTSPMPNPVEEGEETLTKPLSASTSITMEKKSSSSENDPHRRPRKELLGNGRRSDATPYDVRERFCNVTRKLLFLSFSCIYTTYASEDTIRRRLKK